MNGDSVVEINLASPHLDSDSKALDDLVGTLTDDMDAHNVFFGTLYDELESGGLLVILFDHAEVKGLEGGFVWARISTRFPDRRDMFHVQVFTESPYFLRASGSVRPTVPTGG